MPGVSPSVSIRPATPEDASQLREIELRAGERFREVGMPEIADDEPPPVEVLVHYASEGRAWSAVDGDDVPIGYVLVDVVDGDAHIEQVSVDPSRQGQGIGRALVERVRSWATEHQSSSVTLTTFADVTWNVPLYRHLGFHVLAEEEIGAELRALREEETAHGLDPSSRVCMRLDIER